jgi:hypothetical protein
MKTNINEVIFFLESEKSLCDKDRKSVLEDIKVLENELKIHNTRFKKLDDKTVLLKEYNGFRNSVPKEIISLAEEINKLILSINDEMSVKDNREINKKIFDLRTDFKKTCKHQIIFYTKGDHNTDHYDHYWESGSRTCLICGHYERGDKDEDFLKLKENDKRYFYDTNWDRIKNYSKDYNKKIKNILEIDDPKLYTEYLTDILYCPRDVKILCEYFDIIGATK